MGNQTVKQASRYRNKTLQPRDYRQNYSIDVSSRNAGNSFRDDINPPSSQRNRKKSLNVSNNDQSILKYLNDSKQTKINHKNKGFGNGDLLTIDYSPNGAVQSKSRKQNDRILQNLSRKNQDLRKQLKQINEQLTQKLKKKKLVPKKKKNQNDDEIQQKSKQNEARAAGLKRQLQNGHKQIDMYKRTLIQLKSKQQTQVSSVKTKQMQNQVSQLDKIINQTMKKIEGMRNIKKHQQKNIETDINQDLVDNVELLKKEQEQIKLKIKQLTKRDIQRQNNYKKQQAYLFQVEKKYRQLSGQYFPDIKKKNGNQQSGGNKKPSTFDKFSNPQQKKQGEQYPSVFQVKTVTDQLTQLRNKHQEFHKKINSQLQFKNKSNEDIEKLDEEIKVKDKIIQSLKNKLVQIRKIIRPNRKSLFGYDSYQGSQQQSQYGASEADKQIEEQHQDQFDIKHLIANIPKPIRLKPVQMEVNNSIRSGQSGNPKSPSQAGKGMVVTGEKSQPKVWGNVLTRKEQKGKNFKGQLVFDDSVQFQSAQIQPLIIGINVWVNKNGDILALQSIYLNKDEIRYGVKSSSSADGFIVRYDLQAPDYLKNITGSYSQSGILQYVAFYSKKGKAGTFGNKRQNQQSFTFGLASNERPFRLNGATIMVQSQPRICRMGIEICTQ